MSRTTERQLVGLSSISTGPGGMDSLQVTMADDNRTDQQLVLLAAERAGINASFEFHGDGRSLLDRLRQLQPSQLPDLLLMDLQMPGMDGFKVLEELQSHPVLWQIPVSTLSTSAAAGDREEAFNRGAMYFDLKPSNFQDMVDLARLFPTRARAMDYMAPNPLTPLLEAENVDVTPELLQVQQLSSASHNRNN